jgi:hypothetical protein
MCRRPIDDRPLPRDLVQVSLAREFVASTAILLDPVAIPLRCLL